MYLLDVTDARFGHLFDHVHIAEAFRLSKSHSPLNGTSNVPEMDIDRFPGASHVKVKINQYDLEHSIDWNTNLDGRYDRNLILSDADGEEDIVTTRKATWRCSNSRAKICACLCCLQCCHCWEKAGISRTTTN